MKALKQRIELLRQ